MTRKKKNTRAAPATDVYSSSSLGTIVFVLFMCPFLGMKNESLPLAYSPLNTNMSDRCRAKRRLALAAGTGSSTPWGGSIRFTSRSFAEERKKRQRDGEASGTGRTVGVTFGVVGTEDWSEPPVRNKKLVEETDRFPKTRHVLLRSQEISATFRRKSCRFVAEARDIRPIQIGSLHTWKLLYTYVGYGWGKNRPPLTRNSVK